MRKILYFLSILLSGSIGTIAQTYTQVTHTSGVQLVGTTNVTVTPSSPNTPNVGTYCGTGPYQIGKNYSDFYQYSFSPSITHIRLQMLRFHDDDTVEVLVNGNPAPMVLSAYGGTCTPAATTNGMSANNGLITTTGGATGTGQGVQVDISITPNVMNSLRVRHIRHASNNIASDVYYNLFIADDSCSLGFVATVDSPACSGRDIQLDVTQFPNTTYSWTENAPGTPTWSPSQNVRNPILLNANQAHSGQYIVTGTRGTCIYRDTVNVLVTQSPAVGTVNQTGPVCPGESDTIKVPNVSLPIGGWVVAYGAWGRDTFDANQGYIIDKPTVQASDAGLYNVYAVDIQGCVSDTIPFIFQVKPDVIAAFSYKVLEGCVQDTVIFTDNSVGNNARSWFFDDNSPWMASNQTVDTHYYVFPKPDIAPRNYATRIAVTNGLCYDSATQTVTINHPVRVKFEVDDDSICQGTLVTFTDSSYVKPGTQPLTNWYFGDGGKDTTFDTQHQYDRAGIFEAKLVLTDFRGCKDSVTKTIVVDSAGGIFFTTDVESVCVGEEIKFFGQYSVAGYLSAVWDFKDGVTIPDSFNVVHSYEEPGTYNVAFDIDYRICPDKAFSKDIVVKPYPKIYLGEDTAICPEGNPLFIQDIANIGASNISYSWNTPTKDVTQGITVRHPGIYAVKAELDGCTASDTIEVKKNCYINIPNVFTPNGDGHSDYFLPRQTLSRNVTAFTMSIYNRWGEKVFETNSVNGRGWDGKYGGEPQPNGVYIYMIEVSFGNGVSERYHGNLTLIR